MWEDYNSGFGRQIYKKRFHTGEIYFATLKKSGKFTGIERKTTKKSWNRTNIKFNSPQHKNNP
jgi:hypothetical protein